MAEKSFAVIGLGDFGLALTKELLLLRQQVIAIDKSEDQIQRIGSDLPSAFVVDSTKSQALKDGGLSNVDVAIIAFGSNDIKDAMITTFLLTKLGVEDIIVRLDNEEHQEMLRRVGATSFILPTRIAARSQAIKLAGKNIAEYYAMEDHVGVSKLFVPPTFSSKPISDLNWRDEFNINIIFVQKCTNFDPEKFKEGPSTFNARQLHFGKSAVATPNLMIDACDNILIAGYDDDIKRFSNYLSKLKD